MKRITALFICLIMIMSASAFAATVETTGTASVSLAPNTANLSLGIRVFVSDVNEAMSNVNRRVEEIRKAVSGLGVADEDMVAADVYIYNNYDYDTGMNTGYNVSRQMQITIKDVANLGAIIDAALNAGADELNGLTFTSSKHREAYDEAMVLAAQDARKRAEIIAAAEGMTIKALNSMKENETWSINTYAFDGGDGDAKAASTELDLGSLNVQASITAVYEME